MRLTEDLLRQTLAKAGADAEPPAVADVRAAIARAERRRRVIASTVVVVTLVLTLLALVAIGFLRQP